MIKLPTKKQLLKLMGALFCATVIWLPSMHFFFRPNINNYLCQDKSNIPVITQKIAARHLRLWQDASFKNEQLEKMRAINGEWDFMGRTYLVLSLANMALREPAQKDDYVKIIDSIIADTIKVEQEKGMYYFLLPYARYQPFVTKPPHSVFIDGEIGLMLAARRLVKEHPVYKQMMTARISQMVKQMKASPILAAESYPDECWVFCNTIAIATIKIGDVMDGNGNDQFIQNWLKATKKTSNCPQDRITLCILRG